jgi:hypothetical protein
MATVVDTLQIFERLRKTDISESAAKEITEVIKDVVEGHLATKEDVSIIVTEAKVEIVKWVAGMLVAQAALIAALVKLL